MTGIKSMAVGAGHEVYLMIGRPVRQTATPALFNAFCTEHNIPAVMVGLELGSREALLGLIDLWRTCDNLSGLVSTLPFKADLAELMDVRTERADRLGAVNCVRLTGHAALEGDMLDGAGFLAAAQKNGFSPDNARVLLVGAGAAGRAIADALAEASISALDVVEPSLAAREQLQALIGNSGTALHFTSDTQDLSDFDLIVNASPLGMLADDPLPVQGSALRARTLVADCVTNRSMTPLLKMARAAGCSIQQGSEMASGQLPLMLAHFGIAEPVKGERKPAP